MVEAAIVVGVGASEGVGAAVSRRLAREGKSVFIVGRTEERLIVDAASTSRLFQGVSCCFTDPKKSTNTAPKDFLAIANSSAYGC